MKITEQSATDSLRQGGLPGIPKASLARLFKGPGKIVLGDLLQIHDLYPAEPIQIELDNGVVVTVTISHKQDE